MLSENKQNHYVIRGGVEGRERLRILSRVMRPATLAHLNRVGVTTGWSCLDVGCGGGDVTRELARLVGPEGRVVGCDIDARKLELARAETLAAGFANVEYRVHDITRSPIAGPFNGVYSRFLLTHLADPQSVLARLRDSLRPRGHLIVEDIDISGHFSFPASPALDRYVALYSQVVRRNGGDPEIGPKLPALFLDAGLELVTVHVAQPAGYAGDEKLVNALTLENTAQAIQEAGLATAEELTDLIAELYRLAADHRTTASVARIIQVAGRRV